MLKSKLLVITSGLTLIQKAGAFCPGYPRRYEKGVKSTLDPCCKLLQELIMSRPFRIQFPDAWYHVMNHGRRGEKELVEDYNIKIAAYCFMSKKTLTR